MGAYTKVLRKLELTLGAYIYRVIVYDPEHGWMQAGSFLSEDEAMKRAWAVHENSGLANEELDILTLGEWPHKNPYAVRANDG